MDVVGEIAKFLVDHSGGDWKRELAPLCDELCNDYIKHGVAYLWKVPYQLGETLAAYWGKTKELRRLDPKKTDYGKAATITDGDDGRPVMIPRDQIKIFCKDAEGFRREQPSSDALYFGGPQCTWGELEVENPARNHPWLKLLPMITNSEFERLKNLTDAELASVGLMRIPVWRYKATWYGDGKEYRIESKTIMAKDGSLLPPEQRPLEERPKGFSIPPEYMKAVLEHVDVQTDKTAPETKPETWRDREPLL